MGPDSITVNEFFDNIGKIKDDFNKKIDTSKDECEKKINDTKDRVHDMDKKITEIHIDMKHVRRASEGYTEIKDKVKFHNRFIWILISAFTLTFLGTIGYVSREIFLKMLTKG